MTSRDVGTSPCRGGMRTGEFRLTEFRLHPAVWYRCRQPDFKRTRGNAMSRDGLYAIVTGSASGLGAATATLLAKGGARIVVNYSNSQKEAEATAAACREAGAAEVLVVQGDVSRDDDCRKIVAAAAPWGRLDLLINNAGT